jgi:hypothetical protein
MLNTFEPTTTPTPVSSCPATSAADGRRDLGRIRPERRHDPEQRLGEAEPLADPVELAREHHARRDRQCERSREEQQRDRDGHRGTLADCFDVPAP